MGKEHFFTWIRNTFYYLFIFTNVIKVENSLKYKHFNCFGELNASLPKTPRSSKQKIMTKPSKKINGVKILYGTNKIIQCPLTKNNTHKICVQMLARLTRWCRSCPAPSPRSSGRGQPSAGSVLTHNSNSPPESWSACSGSPADTETRAVNIMTV